mgnify:CR=1 FL=1
MAVTKKTTKIRSLKANKTTQNQNNDKPVKILNATSVAKWLIENTTLTFEQIANSTGLDILDVHAISDGFMMANLHSIDPVAKSYFSRTDIENCQKDESLTLTYLQNTKHLFSISEKSKYSYTPMALRYNKISGAMWILQNYPKIPVKKVIKLLKVSASIAESIKDKTYKNVYNLTQQDPVTLGLCSVEVFNEFCNENEQYKQVKKD